jgi:UDP-2,3-diacylglucosamine hydrolase
VAVDADAQTNIRTGMALYIFSDAHLGSGPPDMDRRKIAKIAELCELVKRDGDRLVILGDLFDFWFEYKHSIPKDNHEVLFMLRELVRGKVTVDYLSGNHDFWVGDFFEKQLGLTVHQNTLDMTYAGLRMHLTHGDGLAPGDKGYRVMKWVFRNPLFVWLYRQLPADFATAFARAVSGSSRERTSRRDHTFAVDYEAYAKRKLSDGFDIVAIGHLHIPILQRIDAGWYVNTGDFIGHFSYARLSNSGELELKYLP